MHSLGNGRRSAILDGMSGNVDEVVAALARADTMSRLLATACEGLTRLYEAQRTTISRTIGDLLVELRHHDVGNADAPLELFLVTDYPLTQEVIKQREPRTVLVGSPDADPAEAALMQRLGFQALLMLPLRSRGQNWGLVEVWRERAFTDAEAAAGGVLAAQLGDLLGRLEGAP